MDDVENTTAPESHALLSGCVIVKSDPCPGNKAVIHFGQDGGNRHNGTLFIVHCTILTPYISPVVDLSDTEAGVKYANSMVLDPTGSASGQVLINLRNGAVSANTAGQNVWLSSGFSAPTGGNFSQITIGAAGVLPAFADAGAGDYHLAASFSGTVDQGAAMNAVNLPPPLDSEPLLTFTPLLGTTIRTFLNAPDIGAYEWDPTVMHPDGQTMSSSLQDAGMVKIYDLKGNLISVQSALTNNRYKTNTCPGFILSNTYSGNGNLRKILRASKKEKEITNGSWKKCYTVSIPNGK